MNWRNKLARRRRRPANDFSGRPRFNMSASRSIKSTTSRVKLQSNSFTVHFTCSSTSKRSSTVSNGNRRPLYKSMSSFARVVNGVCTVVVSPSACAHTFGWDMDSSFLLIFESRFCACALILSLSIVCNNFVSLCRSSRCAARLAASSKPDFAMRLASLNRQASSSLYKTLKSSNVFGCIRRSTSRLCLKSASNQRRCSSLASSSQRCARSLHNCLARRRATMPRAWHWMITHFSNRRAAWSALLKYGLLGAISTSRVLSMNSPTFGICVPFSRVHCVDRVLYSYVCTSRWNRITSKSFFCTGAVCVLAWWNVVPYNLFLKPPRYVFSATGRCTCTVTTFSRPCWSVTLNSSASGMT
mmetsp:Transcript_96359/g.294757  ORF Transcript_96359/g.294757 Transcript_96359/m.294757 type:complete len:357 (-) Transcript_96359:330-1400(-)